MLRAIDRIYQARDERSISNPKKSAIGFPGAECDRLFGDGGDRLNLLIIRLKRLELIDRESSEMSDRFQREILLEHVEGDRSGLLQGNGFSNLMFYRESQFSFHTDPQCNHSAIAAQRLEIMRALAYYETQWSEPILFVLSHLDGLQGRIDKTSTGWRLMGVIDVEDHYFTDQRFVLAVFELVAERQNISILPDFWDAYQQQTTLNPTYWKLRPLFQLYVLLSWIKDKPLEQQKIVADLSHKIAMCCQLKE